MGLRQIKGPTVQHQRARVDHAKVQSYLCSSLTNMEMALADMEIHKISSKMLLNHGWARCEVVGVILEEEKQKLEWMVSGSTG